MYRSTSIIRITKILNEARGGFDVRIEVMEGTERPEVRTAFLKPGDSAELIVHLAVSEQHTTSQESSQSSQESGSEDPQSTGLWTQLKQALVGQRT